MMTVFLVGLGTIVGVLLCLWIVGAIYVSLRGRRNVQVRNNPFKEPMGYVIFWGVVVILVGVCIFASCMAMGKIITDVFDI